MRDLRGGEPAEQPQRQSDLNAAAERGVAAGEDQPQTLVTHGALLDWFVAGMQQRSLGVPVIT
jgi:hypothetical protein